MATTHRSSSLSFLHRRSSVARSDSVDSLFSPPTNIMSRLRTRKPSHTSSTITPTEAVWFLSLPEKVRRQHFTKEEQILIRAKSEIALLDSSPETLAHIEEAHADHTNHLRARSVAFDRSQQPALPSPSLFQTRDFRKTSLDTQRSGSPRRTTPDMPHNQFLPGSVSPKRQQSFLRSPTINEYPWDLSNPSGAGSPSSDTIRRPSTARSIQRAAIPPPIDVKQPLYIKDPNTKALLRERLAANRFEETLAFGFPSTHTAWPKRPSTASETGMLVSNSSFLYNSEASSSEDSVELSSADEVEPPTPDSLIQPQIIRTKALDPYCPADRLYEEDEDEEAAVPFNVLRNASNTSYFEELMSRDMTLRMTLTKPELRASEQELYGWQEENNNERIPPAGLDDDDGKDPLALATLTFSDDVTGLHGAFAQELERKKGIKGLWYKK